MLFSRLLISKKPTKMKIPTVNKFLFCMTLETGGTFYRDIDIAIGFNLNYFFTGVFVSWFQGIVSIVAIII